MPAPAPVPPADKPALSKARLGLALAVAGASDAISIAAELIPPLQLSVDIATAGVLLLVLGFRWQLLPALVVEAIPGLALFPTWIAAVLAIIGFLPRQGAGAARVIDGTAPKRPDERR